MRPSPETIWTTYTECVRFVVSQLLPEVLAAVGEHDLAERLANAPLGREGGNAVMAVERASVELMGARMRQAMRDAGLADKSVADEDLPPGVLDTRDALRGIVAGDHIHSTWDRVSRDTSFHLTEGMAEVTWRRAHEAVRQLCCDVERLAVGRTGYRARLVARHVRWEDVQAHFDDLDDASAARACQLASSTAFHHTNADFVFGRAAEITDAACDEVCTVLGQSGVWATTALDAAKELPLETLHAAQVLWSASVSAPYDAHQGRRTGSLQGLFCEALAEAPTLDAESAELAARLAGAGLPISEAADAARAAVQAPVTATW